MPPAGQVGTGDLLQTRDQVDHRGRAGRSRHRTVESDTVSDRDNGPERQPVTRVAIIEREVRGQEIQVVTHRSAEGGRRTTRECRRRRDVGRDLRIRDILQERHNGLCRYSARLVHHLAAERVVAVRRTGPTIRDTVAHTCRRGGRDSAGRNRHRNVDRPTARGGSYHEGARVNLHPRTQRRSRDAGHVLCRRKGDPHSRSTGRGVIDGLVLDTGHLNIRGRRVVDAEGVGRMTPASASCKGNVAHVAEVVREACLNVVFIIRQPHEETGGGRSRGARKRNEIGVAQDARSTHRKTRQSGT